MAIQNRRGAFKDFNPSKMLPGEFAVTTDGSNKIFMGFNPGVVKEVALQEQIPTNNNQLQNGADYATVTQVTKGLNLKVDKTTQKQVDDNQNTEIESLKRKDIAHDNSITLINQTINTINTKNSQQDKAIKKNADDILTKVDKTTQQNKDSEQDKAIDKNTASIITNAIKPNVKGNPIIVNDSSDSNPVNLEIRGSTSQIVTTGKNLFDFDDFKKQCSVAYSISGNGTEFTYLYRSQNKVRFNIDTIGGLPLYIKGIAKSNKFNGKALIVYLDERKKSLFEFFDEQGHKYEFNFKAEKDVKAIDFEVYSGSITIENMFISHTDSPYEPYTGGKPSPSPEYTQEIVNGVFNTVDCNGKNLLKNDFAITDMNNVHFTVNKDKSITINGKPNKSFVWVIGTIDVSNLVGQNVVIPRTYVNGLRMYVHLMINGENQINWLDSRHTFTKKIPENSTILELGVEILVTYSGDTYTVYPQVELGTVATSFEPYKGFSETFPQVTLSKWDKVKKIDEVWKKEINSNRMKITSVKYVDQLNNVLRIIVNINMATKKDTDDIFCNKLKTVVSWPLEEEHIYADKNSAFLFLEKTRFKGDFSISNIEKFINENDYEVLYITLTPTYEVLPQAVQNVLNKIQTFYPNSTIQTSEGIELNLTYVADSKNYIDNKFKELQTAMIAVGGKI